MYELTFVDRVTNWITDILDKRPDLPFNIRFD